MKKTKYFFLSFISLLLSSCEFIITSENTSINHDLLNYGENYKEENTIANQENLAGMCYLFYERNEQINYKEALKAMKNLGVKSLRTWMHFKYFMSDPETINSQKADLIHEYLKEAIDLGFQIIGMNHTNYHEEGYFSIGKEERVHFDDQDSKYNRWLENYKKSWYTLASEFSEISYWEIDNEINNPDFMYIEGKKDDVLNITEMAQISADMLYYGSLGIHEANPDANTIMGGLVDSLGLGLGSYYNGVYTGNNKQFLNVLYDCIDSGEHHSLHYDDFFQIAAWHPYYYTKTADEYFVMENNDIYNIIKKREKKDKKVFLTEFGWADSNTNGNTGQYIKDLYITLKEQMPYVESLHYYILFDKVGVNECGLFTDPSIGGTPKDSAYAYQEINQGKGTLTYNFLKNING